KVDGSSLYKGPVEYPKMMYHPLGETRIVVPAEVLQTPLGPKLVGEQREMLHKTVGNEAEEAALVAEGWHDHPAKSVKAKVMAEIKANPKISEKDKARLLASIPQISSETRIRELEAEMERLKSMLKEEKEEAEEEKATAPGKSTLAGPGK